MSDHDRLLERVCASFRARLKLLQMQSGVARLIILGVAVLPLFLTLDWWIHLSTWWRLLGLIAYLGALAATLWFTLLKPLARKWSNREVLGYLDSTAPAGEGMLLDLYELRRGERIQESVTETGQALVDDAIERLTPLAERRSVGAALEATNVRRWLAGALIAAVLFIGVGAALSEHAIIGCKRFFNPFSHAYWPHRTDIQIVEPANGWSIPQMENFPLEAKVSGVVPPQVVVSYKSESAGFWIREKVEVRNGVVAYEFKEVGAPITFSFAGGDFETNQQTITVVKRPSLSGIVAHYQYPVYAGIPNKDERTGQLRGLEGTKVKLDFTTSIPVVRALFILDDGEPEELKLASESTFSKELMLAKDGVYVIQLFDQNGFREPASKPERYQIQVKQDEPPVLDLLSPAADIAVTKNVKVRVKFKARDDFGLQKVSVGYQLGDGELIPLSTRITGPIKQEGMVCEHEFDWDLHRMEELPEQGSLTCSVTVQDVNPTGRGVETRQFKIDLIKTSEFHRKAVAEAQDLIAEGKNAYNHQWRAWEVEQKELTAGGSGKPDDSAWQEMVDEQDKAKQAATAMAAHLARLTEAYESNNLEREFMAGRLKQIDQLLHKAIGAADAELPQIADGLRKARPNASADEVAEKLKILRGNAVKAIQDHQKMTLALLDQIMFKAYDWRDLQTATIQTSLLVEDQGDLRGIVEKVAPNYVGKEREDLSDEQQTELERIGTRQRGLFDSEAQLEIALSNMIWAAKKQKRKNILGHLEAPFSLLRSNRVKDLLEAAAAKITNNQIFAIKDELRKALETMSAVKMGLVVAGDKLDPDEPVTVATPLPEKRDLEAVKPEDEPKKTDETQPADESEGTVAKNDPANLTRILPPGQDKLSLMLAQTSEAVRSVASRIAYLAQDRDKAEMPRAMKLNHARVQEMQSRAEAVLGQASDSANEAASPLPKERLAAYAEHLRQVASLLSEKNLGALTQQLEDDVIRGLDGLVQYVAFQKKVDEATVDNKKGNGIDSHQQKFLLREKNLEIAEALVRTLSGIATVEKEVQRSANRFAKAPAALDGEKAIEQKNRSAVAADQAKLAAQTLEAAKSGDAFSAEVAQRVKDAGLAKIAEAKLAAIGEAIAAAKDKDAAAQLDEATATLDSALSTLLDLLEEREKVEVVVAQKAEAPITREEFEKMTGPQALADRLKADTRLPPAIRERMLAELGKGFPKEYQDLLSAYYASCIEEDAK